MVWENFYSLSDNSEQGQIMNHASACNSGDNSINTKEIGESGAAGEAREQRADGVIVRAGYHESRKELRPTHFSAKARCTQVPDGQRFPSQSSLSGTPSGDRTSKHSH